MKKIILVAIIFLLSNTVCFARLGETVRQSESRYGKPIARPVKKGDLLSARYRTDLFNVGIDFRNGVAVAISFQRKNGKKMSMKRIERILRENGVREDANVQGLKAIWYFQPKMKRAGVVEFIDDPGKTRASYSLKKNLLIIQFISGGR